MSDLPDDVVDAAERLTRRAAAAPDPREAAEYRRDRDERLATHGYAARVRDDRSGRTLVLFPGEWLEDGTIRPGGIDDTDRAVERPLSGTGDDAAWASVDAHNRRVVEEVASAHGSVHAANVAAFADFMGNHYVRRIERASPALVREFLEEYFPRNAWPTPAQRDAVEESLRRAFEASDAPVPAPIRSE